MGGKRKILAKHTALSFACFPCLFSLTESLASSACALAAVQTAAAQGPSKPNKLK